jgi:serine/threonine-protein kinase
MSEPSSVSSEDCFAGEGLPRRFGRYLLLKLVARGGMGQLMLASTTGVEGAERPVVVKVIRREHAQDPNFLARFLDEARVQAQLNHSGVALVLEADTAEPGGEPYVVLEYVEGRSLGSVRRRLSDVGVRLGWFDAVATGALLAEALAFVHERADASGRPLAIVHRDLSPHNVMIGYAGEVKIIDFGTARAHNRRCHTVSGVVFAKPGYVAPEVANGETGDARVDMYALGVMIWELCAGRRFLQGDAQEHMAEVASGKRNLPPLAELAHVPVELDRVIERLAAFDREARYPSCRVAAAELATLLRTAPPLSNGERGIRARVAQLMYTLYPDEPLRSRREFARLVGAARAAERTAATVAAGEPAGVAAEPERPSKGPALGRASTEPPAPAEDEEKTRARPSSPDEPLAGTRYRLIRRIGRGASSSVHEAEHVDLGRRVALKLLDAEHTCSRDFTTRFRREARALSRLAHPGLCRVYDFGQAADGRLFCALELLEGESLRALLAREGRLDWRRALRIARQAALALELAHRHGIVHRDVKPENLFLTSAGLVKILDFGLSATEGELAGGGSAADGGPASEAARGALCLFGTPEYMAPEQAAGGRVDGSADVYALGCVLYEMLSGEVPFRGSSPVAVIEQKLEGSPASLCTPRRAVPRAVDRVVMRALARHPSRRWGGAGPLAEALAGALAEPGRRRARRRAGGAAVLSAVLAFAGVLLWRHGGPLVDALRGRVPWLATGAADAAMAEPPRERDASPAPAEPRRPAGDHAPSREPSRSPAAPPPPSATERDAAKEASIVTLPDIVIAGK